MSAGRACSPLGEVVEGDGRDVGRYIDRAAGRPDRVEGPSLSGLRSLSANARRSEHSGHEDGRDP